MPNLRRSDDDARLQRLANLSIEIRMLKARAQAAFEEHDNSAGGAYVPDAVPGRRTAQSAASCPHCGHTAGLSLLPREYRRLSTLVRCFACQRDSAALQWVASSGPDAQPHA